MEGDTRRRQKMTPLHLAEEDERQYLAAMKRHGNHERAIQEVAGIVRKLMDVPFGLIREISHMAALLAGVW